MYPDQIILDQGQNGLPHRRPAQTEHSLKLGFVDKLPWKQLLLKNHALDLAASRLMCSLIDYLNLIRITAWRPGRYQVSNREHIAILDAIIEQRMEDACQLLSDPGTPVPTLKIATNSALAGRKGGWIDYDAGGLARGEGWHPAHQRVGRDAGQAVGAPTFQTDDQLFRANGFPPVFSRPARQCAQQAGAGGKRGRGIRLAPPLRLLPNGGGPGAHPAHPLRPHPPPQCGRCAGAGTGL